MNYLVHLYLAGPDPELQLGGLMGDFVKGPIPQDIPAGIARGLRLHRRIDTLAHSSVYTRRSRQRLDPRFRHGRGILVDIFYDHFLASSWADYCAQPLEGYAEDVYRLLERHHAQLPDEMQEVAVRMMTHNWLVSYRHREVVGKALQRISGRLKRPLALEESVADLRAHESLLREDFRNFMTEALVFVDREFAIYGLTP